MTGPGRAYPPWGASERQRSGEMRGHALRLWKGAHWLEAPNLDGDLFYGWSVLSLTVRFDYPLRLESRIVYAHLFDKDQPGAILRAVSWDTGAAHDAISQLRASAPLIVPARFVRLTADQLRQWLAPFRNLIVTAEQTVVQDTSLPIRGVRIEWEYTSCVLEKVWQEQGPQHDALMAAWTTIWASMGEALRTQPSLEPAGFEEDFEEVVPDRSAYDAGSYDPRWLTLA
jgi:hypothetical protein